MSKIVKISEIIGDNLAVTAEKGEKVFEILKQNIVLSIITPIQNYCNIFYNVFYNV